MEIGQYEIRTGFENMDAESVHRFISEASYWAKGIPYETVEISMKNSFCVGIFLKNEQVGFARLITDYATFAYLADVYVLEGHRGKGLSKMIMDFIMNLDFMPGLRRILLATLDAHLLYKQFGFNVVENPERFMEIRRSNIYK